MILTVLFFEDKHGQLGIWDAQAPPEEIEDEDGDVHAQEDREGGKYWRMQPHWPATSKSSISCIKMDPLDAHSVCVVLFLSSACSSICYHFEGIHECIRLHNPPVVFHIWHFYRDILYGRRTHFEY